MENLDVDVRIILIVFDINSMACIGLIWPRTGHTRLPTCSQNFTFNEIKGD